MKTSPRSFFPALPYRSTRLSRGVALLVASSALVTSLSAQAPATATDPNNADQNGRNRRGNFSPADAQARMLSTLRDQFAVKDDAEWSLISERITTVFDLRRSLGGGGGNFNPRNAGGDNGGNQRNRGNNFGNNTELAALRSAIADNLPDAEVKARLDRLREVRKQNEAKLAKAQDDLRAVLTLRQEAVAVAAGLLN